MNIQSLKIIIAMLTFISSLSAQEWQSKIVYFDAFNKLVYVRDSLGNRIPDFSFAGYKNGNQHIPEIPIVKTIVPVNGDNTANIMNALNDIANNFQVKANGFRGALLLSAGRYEIFGTLKINYSGIVLKGVGSGSNADSNTILIAKGNSPVKRSLIIAGGGVSTKWNDMVSGTKVDITSDTVLIGKTSFEVENASKFKIGDNIIIYHPCSEKWLKTINYGGTHSNDPGADTNDIPWTVGSQPIVYNRWITDIQGNNITVDVPIFYTLIRDISQSYIYKYSRLGLKTNIGIENLRIEIETSGQFNNENHAQNAVDLILVEDAWIRNVTATHFSLSGFRTNTATRVTIENCKALDPVSEITGGRRYNFNAYTASQQILFQNNLATNGRHSYMSNGMSWNSGIVFYNNSADSSYAASEGHRRWSQGLLYDNHQELSNVRPDYNKRRIGLYNRGYYGTSHGWASVNSIAWNCDVKNGQIIIQQPPTAQNYAIGCFASLVAGYGESSFDEPTGYIEGTGKTGLNPPSLYLAQYQERINSIVNVSDHELNSITPDKFILYPNYPNPFNPETSIKFDLPSRSNINISIYNVLGQKIVNLFDGYLNSGLHTVNFNASQLSSAVYFYIVTAKSSNGLKYFDSKKMILLK